jgi:hypothetical protein
MILGIPVQLLAFQYLLFFEDNSVSPGEIMSVPWTVFDFETLDGFAILLLTTPKVWRVGGNRAQLNESQEDVKPKVLSYLAALQKLLP